MGRGDRSALIAADYGRYLGRLQQKRIQGDLARFVAAPRGPWSVRLTRTKDEAKRRQAAQQRPKDRSLVIVIRDWGSPSERVALVRSIEAEDGGVILEGGR